MEMMTTEDWLTSFIHELRRLRPDIPRSEAHHVGSTLHEDGNADPASAAKLFESRGARPAMRSDDWVACFVEELQSLRPTVSVNLARTIAAIWYSRGPHSDPEMAAQDYAKSQQGRPPG
jgi:hypothetical protein